MIFADTSALVKLYADEPGSAGMRQLSVIVLSALSRVEGTSAIWRKVGQGDLDETEAGKLIREFHADLRSPRDRGIELLAMPVTPELLRSAARLVPVHDLRALDALQLSSALAAREADPACDTFACYDNTLARAAAAHGFSIHSPTA